MERRERVGATRLAFSELIESELEVEESAVTCGANGRGVFRDQSQRRWSSWRQQAVAHFMYEEVREWYSFFWSVVDSRRPWSFVDSERRIHACAGKGCTRTLKCVRLRRTSGDTQGGQSIDIGHHAVFLRCESQTMWPHIRNRVHDFPCFHKVLTELPVEQVLQESHRRKLYAALQWSCAWVHSSSAGSSWIR